MKLFIPVVLASVLLCGCNGATPREADSKAPPGTPADVTLNAEQIAHGGVRWSAAVATPLAESVELTGRLVVDEDHTARLSPSVKGRVTAVRANLGDAVSAGQPLVTLQSEEASARRADLAKAAAAVTEAQAALTYARTIRERAERLLALKAGSAQDVERARADEAAADSHLRQAQTAEEQSRKALSVLQVDAATGEIQLASPIAGLVVARDAVDGAVIDAGVAALTVSDLRSLWLEFGAPDSVANQLQPGQSVSFSVSGLGGTFEARLLRTNGALDPATRLVTVRASVANSAAKLRPEMFVTVRAATTAARPTITLPRDAVQLVDESPSVFIAEPDGKGGAKFIRRAVTTGSTSDGRTQIIYGVKPGDVVVTDGAFAVKSIFSRAKMPAGG
jgi:cobalt-zinc-cadmium efflux system membrane fusion protein